MIDELSPLPTCDVEVLSRACQYGVTSPVGVVKVQHNSNFQQERSEA